MSKKYAVIFLAWGDRYLKEVENCIQNSPPIQQYDFILITDHTTSVKENGELFTKIIRTDFKHDGFLRKTELVYNIPEGYDAYLFLDNDTTVLEDISLGFKKAKKYSMALAAAPHYSLNDFWGFSSVMEKEGIPLQGQLLYNSGVIFFTYNSEVVKVFKKWYQLAKKHQIHNDQPLLTLAMELIGVNPYTLSRSYNYRGFGELISGKVFIWHSHNAVPKKINDFDNPWPPRRVYRGEIEGLGDSASVKRILKRRLKRFIKRFI